MRKDHGNHNLALCNLLLNDGNYNDWVITTAFYSATHYLEHALFPLVEDSVLYPDFGDYWNRKFKKRKVSKHNCKLKLAWKYLRSVSSEYRELYDDCMTSRYNNYKVSDQAAKDAISKANKFKGECLRIKP